MQTCDIGFIFNFLATGLTEREPKLNYHHFGSDQSPCLISDFMLSIDSENQNSIITPEYFIYFDQLRFR